MIFQICIVAMVTGLTSGVAIEKISSWSVDAANNVNRVEAKFSIPVTSPISEWNVKLTFTKPTRDLEIWKAVKECNDADGYWYIVKNHPYKEVFQTALGMKFQLDYDGSSPIGSGSEAVLVGTDACTSTDSGTGGNTGTGGDTGANTGVDTGTGGDTGAGDGTSTGSECQLDTGALSLWRLWPSTDHRQESKFTIVFTQETTDWKVRLRFSKPTKNFQNWKANVQSNSDGTEYILTNMHQTTFTAGQSLDVNFQFSFANQDSPTIEAVLLEPCNGGSTGGGDTGGNGGDTGGDGGNTGGEGGNTGGDGGNTGGETGGDGGNTGGETGGDGGNTGGDGGDTGGDGGTNGGTGGTGGSGGSSDDAPIDLMCAESVAGSGPYDYSEVIAKSILFYEAQRSGKLPANNRLEWRKDSATNDKGVDGEPLDGGWYDAGDYVKFGFPMASSVTTLAWGLVNWKQAYVASCQLEWMYESIKWPLDYFIKAHDQTTDRFYVQVGNGKLDHDYWGRPEDMKMVRPAYFVDPMKPGTEPTAETAAAMAAGAMAFAEKDAEYSATLLEHAEQLFDFAYNNQRDYIESVPEASPFYNSYSGFKDELAWAAAWLFYATGETYYKTKADEQINLKDQPMEFSWDEKTIGAVAILFHITKDPSYSATLKTFLKYWKPGGGIHYTPKGLAWYLRWGSLRYASNAALIALVAADNGINKQENIDWAKTQIHYALGDTGRSFVVGFGNNPPQRPHHASSSCALEPATCDWGTYGSSEPNPHVLYGALVGGPSSGDEYKDVRTDYIMNEVACDYNAGFQSAVAGLKYFQMQGL